MNVYSELKFIEEISVENHFLYFFNVPIVFYTSITTTGLTKRPKLSFISRSFSEDLEPSSTLDSPSYETKSKLLKVAIIGRPNAGKSTLINRIMNLNVCDVSKKTHTTRVPLRAAFISGDTQIVFVDTPGVVYKKEFKKFDLDDSFKTWTNDVFKEVDIIGVIFEAQLISRPKSFRKSVLHLLSGLPESIPSFVIFNKIDLLKEKRNLLKVSKDLVEGNELQGEEERTKKFTMAFYVSALKNDGLKDIIDYLLYEAKPGEWLWPRDKIFDIPLHVLIENLIRAKLLNLLPHETPYECKYEVEYLEENDRNELNCVVLVTCKTFRHLGIIIGKHKNFLKELVETVQNDLFQILRKVIRIRLVVVKKESKNKNFKSSGKNFANTAMS